MRNLKAIESYIASTDLLHDLYKLSSEYIIGNVRKQLR